MCGIILMSVVAAVIYGLLHDLVTAHLCLEYFTIGHQPPDAIPHDPLTMVLLYGVIATWWVGLGLGIPLALVARLGAPPRLTARELVPSMLALLGGMYLLAALAGALGYGLASMGAVFLVAPLSTKVPASVQTAFLGVGFAHVASYLGGLVGGLGLMYRTWRRRGYRLEIHRDLTETTASRFKAP